MLPDHFCVKRSAILQKLEIETLILLATSGRARITESDLSHAMQWQTERTVGQAMDLFSLARDRLEGQLGYTVEIWVDPHSRFGDRFRLVGMDVWSPLRF